MKGAAVEVGWKQIIQSLIDVIKSVDCIIRAMGHYWRLKAGE